jgi:hypothetical protein
MERRDLLKWIGVITGTAVVGGELFLTGCKTEAKVPSLPLSAADITLLDEIAETIIPKTNTPGAKEAEVGKFIDIILRDCYDTSDQATFLVGLADIQKKSAEKYKKDFIALTADQKKELLTSLDAEAKQVLANIRSGKPSSAVIMNVDTAAYNKEAKEINKVHYFTMMKQLTLLGFFTSKPGATEALRHVAVPGKYDGCIDYKKGDRAWAV